MMFFLIGLTVLCLFVWVHERRKKRLRVAASVALPPNYGRDGFGKRQPPPGSHPGELTPQQLDAVLRRTTFTANQHAERVAVQDDFDLVTIPGPRGENECCFSVCRESGVVHGVDPEVLQRVVAVARAADRPAFFSVSLKTAGRVNQELPAALVVPTNPNHNLELVVLTGGSWSEIRLRMFLQAAVTTAAWQCATTAPPAVPLVTARDVLRLILLLTKRVTWPSIPRAAPALTVVTARDVPHLMVLLDHCNAGGRAAEAAADAAATNRARAQELGDIFASLVGRYTTE